jgi:type I restriction enzyme, S subunit
MQNCSRGAAGRNRPLDTWSLEREQILIPSAATQKKIARLVTLEGKIRQLVGQYVKRAIELRASLITAAVTGQIDVATWYKPGTAQKTRDWVEEGLPA